MTYVLFPVIQFNDNSGSPLASGNILTYVGGTTTPLASYTNSTGTLAANPVALNASGRPNNGTGMWLDSNSVYKFVIRDSNNNEIQTIDNYSPAGSDINQIATNVQFVTLASTSSLAAERVLTAGSGISLTDAGAGSTITAAVNINGLTEDTSPDLAADYVPTYDASATANKKALLNNILKPLPIVSGKLYGCGDNRNNACYIANSGTPGAITIDTVYYVPIIFSRAVTISAIVCHVSTEHVGSNLRLGLYAASTTTLLPTGSVIADSGNISTTGTGQKSFSTTQTLAAHTLYYLAFNTASSTIRTLQLSSTWPNALYIPVETSLANTPRNTFAFSQSSAFGAFPTVSSPSNVTSTSTNIPFLGVLVA